MSGKLPGFAVASHRLIALAVLSLALAMASLAPVAAQTLRTNTATVTPATAVTDGDMTNNTDDAIVSVSAATAYNFCPAGGAILAVDGLQFHHRTIGVPIPALADTALDPTQFEGEALMIDQPRNRALYVARSATQVLLRAYDFSAAGWYTAATLPASADPRAAAMTASGIGYIIDDGFSPTVWRVELAPNGTDYTVTDIGNLVFDHPPSFSTADFAFDAGGIAWLSAGHDLYTVDLAGGSLTTRRQGLVTTVGGLATGVAFDAANQLFVTNLLGTTSNTYVPSTGASSTMADTGASLDTASCAQPVLAPAALVVTKTLAEVNGVPYVAGAGIVPGDTLAYNIRVANSGGVVRPLWVGDVVETLPLNTTAVASGNDFTCTGTSCPNTADASVVAGGNLDLGFVVQVDDPLPLGTSTISNAVAVALVDCAVGNDCVEVTPLASSVAVSKSSDAGNGTPVAAGDTITYTVRVAVANNVTATPVQVTDTLGAGLVFGSITSSPGFTCSSTPSSLQCALAAGAAVGNHDLVYTATVASTATTSVGNSVVTDTGICTSCSTTNPLLAATSVVKTSDPATGTTVVEGTVITYTVTATVANAALGEDLVLVDTPGAGLGSIMVTNSGSFTSCTGTGPLTCILPAGTPIGSYPLVYTATVEPGATGSVGNSVVASNAAGGDPDPTCTACSTTHPISPAGITVSKSANPAAGTTVAPLDSIEYTLTTTVANSALTQDLVLTDTLGTGLEFDAVTSAGAFNCTGSAPLTCTLPAGTGTGVHSLTYRADVTYFAVGSVVNSVVASNAPGGDPDPACTTCSIAHPIVPTQTTLEKIAVPATGSTVMPGTPIEYTVAVVVAGSSLTEDITLVDTLGAGLVFDRVVDAGLFTCTGELTCTLAAGTIPGNYAVVYSAMVVAGATGTVSNSVVAGTPVGGDPDPVCGTCTTTHAITPTTISVAKSADPGAGVEVRVGDTIAYTLTATVANSATTAPLVLTDTLGTGLSLGAVTDAGAFTCTGTLECVLPADTLPGVYALEYTAVVQPEARSRVLNTVAATGGGTTPDCSSCSVEHALAPPTVTLSKTSLPAPGTEVRIGESIEYTLTAIVANSATLADVALVDVPGAGLDVSTLPAGCTAAGDGFRCMLPAGTAPGVATFSYVATVNSDAGATVGNVLSGESAGTAPICDGCETEHPVIDETWLRIVKTAGARTTRIGDLLRYTLTIQNIGARNYAGGTVLDTPPAGFGYVEGSMAVADGDGAFNLASGTSPLRIEGLDIPAGEQATVTYLLRVGAGVRAGVHVNEAVAVGSDGGPISNIATARVMVGSDPMLSDSLVFGTVYDDRDGDGWQDSAGLDGVHVQGGFAPGAYIPGSTTVDRGQGQVAQADASAPLLHGLDIGRIEGRGSIADHAATRQVVIRQRLREPAFTDDFVLSSEQGVTLRMDADGTTRIERSGDAARDMGAGEPVVERRIARVEGGYEVAYAIGNAGIDERGIPGVRLASVEGLLVETDQYGRFHLVDVHGGDQAHGRNYILKVDPATLPAGTEFTTANPLVRRVTAGLPVRFGFGARLPVQEIPGRTEVLEVQLGEVFFAPGSAQLRDEYLPAVVEMAKQVDARGGGEVVISANGGSESLAIARAAALRDALVVRMGAEAAGATQVSIRTDVDDPHSTVAMLEGSDLLLGTVLFDTDSAAIRPEFEGLLDGVARRLGEMGGGVVAIVGHTDVRASHAYNAALGLRRAQAVFDALAARLDPEVRARLRVEASTDVDAPLGSGQL